jgi:hypothetical protein
MTTPFDKGLWKLRSALKRLDGTEDRPIARRNARARVLGSMRLIRAVLNREYPAIKVAKTVVRLKTDRGRLDRLTRAGWKLVMNASSYAAAGVPVRELWLTAEMRSASTSNHRLFVPDWAVAIGPDKPAQLRAAKRSRKLRDTARTVAALKNQP